MGIDFGGEGMDMVGFGLAGGGVVAWLAQAVWSRLFGEGKMRAELMDQLNSRISAQEIRLLNLEGQVENERNHRRDAEDKVSKLEYVVALLEAELRKHGISVPQLPVWKSPIDEE